MIRAVRFALILIAGMAGAATTGCSSFGLSLGEQDETTLLVSANRFYIAGNYVASSETYLKLLNSKPDSPYRPIAQLGLADSYYRNGSNVEASPQYMRFYEIYPRHKFAPRAYYYAAMSYFNDRVSVDRDQGTTADARRLFEKLVEKFPNSPLAIPASEKIKECIALEAMHEFLVGKYYYDLGDDQATIVRLNYAVKKYPDQPFVPAATFYIADAYFREQSFAKAKQLFSQYIEKYPTSPEVAQASARIAVIDSLGIKYD